MIKDRVAFDLPAYDGLLAGHYIRGAGYGRKRQGGTDDWLLVLTLAGTGRIQSGANELRAVEKSLFLIAPGTTHDYGTARDAETWEILWVHFHPKSEWIDLLTWPSVGPGIFALHDSPHSEAFENVVRLSSGFGTRDRLFAMNALEKLLLLCDEQVPRSEMRRDDRIRSTIDFVDANLQGPLSLTDLSERVHLSPSRFAHLFRQTMGIPPRQYVLQQRLQRARTLLERTSLGIAEVATEVGMEPFYFTLRFKSETGVSPREFRKRLSAS